MSDSRSGEETSTIGFELNLSVLEPWLRLHYRLVRRDESLDYKVMLTTTELPWHGVRWWFICPLVRNGRSCNRRVAKLYLPPGGRYYGCRHCYALTYTSCQESHKYDRLRRGLAGECNSPRISVMDLLEWECREERRMEQAVKRREQRQRRKRLRGPPPPIGKQPLKWTSLAELVASEPVLPVSG